MENVFLTELERDRSAVQEAHTYIIDTINDALKQGDTERLIGLLPYIEEGAGSITLKYINEVHDIVRILNTIKLERKYAPDKELFSSGCKNFEELYGKYHLAVFSFRRMLFMLSDASVEEAIGFLQDNSVSEFAAYMIVKDALKLPDSVAQNLIGALYGERK